MSWSCGGKVGSSDEVDEILRLWAQANPQQVTDETRQQTGLAVRIAKEIIDAPERALGNVAVYNVYLSGHANPGHAKTLGYSNDSVSVSVSVAEYAES